MRSSPFDPELIEVIAVNGRPSHVNFKKRLQTVREISNLWRVDDGWWIRPVIRLYYTLELENGSRITVFYDLLSGTWYKQNWATE
jgi:hypothetical protein